MKALRRLGFALWLALALVAGQQVAVLHALGHATETFSQKDPKQAPSKCGECFACSQLSAGAAATVPNVPGVQCGIDTTTVVAKGEQVAPSVPYLSRAPPILL